MLICRKGIAMVSDHYKNIFEKIFKMSLDGFILTDTDGLVMDINDQYADFFGLDRDAIIGHSILEIIPNSKMIDITRNRYTEEDVIHTYISGKVKNQSVTVSRSYVENDEGEVIAGVAQVKFRLQALAVANKLMNEYAELEFYREAYKGQNLANVIGSSAIFVGKLNECLKIAKTDFSVLLTGETGTGKEVFAKVIHNNSSRKEKPLISINCAAIPKELFESELFGYEEGAFTGARKKGKKGKFLLANGGTLFLDEIGDMPLPMQVKILRVLQEREIEPVGAEEAVPIDVRIIAATRQNLEEKIKNGSFREDLYYRLNEFHIDLPSLRERGKDVIELAEHFLNELNLKYKTYKTLSQDVVNVFNGYHWPGNVREVNNVIKSAYAICDNAVIGLEDLPRKMVEVQREQIVSEYETLEDMMDAFEKQVLIDLLRRHRFNCSDAAKAAGIHRSAFYRKMNKYDIKKEDFYR